MLYLSVNRYIGLTLHIQGLFLINHSLRHVGGGNLVLRHSVFRFAPLKTPATYYLTLSLWDVLTVVGSNFAMLYFEIFLIYI